VDYALIEAVEASAILVLQEYRKAHPQWNDDITPVQDIASWLGLEVATFDPQDYPQGTYGFMDADEDESLIWLCRDLSTNLQRFTLAHEIGHALFHCQEGRRLLAIAPQYAPLLLHSEAQTQLPKLSREQPCQQSEIQEDLAGIQEQDQLQEVLGAHGYSPRSKRELVANLFAAELLIPRAHLITLYLQAGVAARTLATHFQVSEVALLNRLAGLYNDKTLLKQSFTSPGGEMPADDTPSNTTDEHNATQKETADTGDNSTQPSLTASRKRYDNFQQAAISAQTPALIIAGPGSGKTSTLIGRIDYLVNTHQIPATEILALTFSRKATQEMEERLHQMLPITAGFPHVSTFHAFCADLLREYGKQVGLRPDFTLIDDAEGYYILQQQTDTLRLHHYQKLQAPTFYFPDLLKIISRAKDELVTPAEYAQRAKRLLEHATDEEMTISAEKAQEIAHIYALYEQELQRRGDTDFGGLLMLTISLLQTQPEIRHHIQGYYQHILVDEFQDVNRASGVLLRELAGTAQRVWVVGDANQAIYGFRGASPANIQQFTHDFPSAHIFPLSRNYRSLPDLVTIAEAFRTQHLEAGETHTQNQPARPTHPDPYVTIASAKDERHEIAGMLQDMRDKHHQGYAYHDMVVLCRTRAHAQKISQAIAHANLPVVEQEGILEQEHIKDLISFLLLLVDDSGMGLLRAGRIAEHPLSQEDIETILIAARDAEKTGVRRLLFDALAPLSLSPEGRHSLLRLSEILNALTKQAQNTWSALAQYLLIETNLLRNLLDPGAEPALTTKERLSRIADYQQLLQMARHFDQQQLQRQPARSSTAPFTAAVRTEEQTESRSEATPPQEESLSLEEQLKGFLDYLNLLILLRQDNGNRQDSDAETTEAADTIRVMTVHASKGLEFPVVYLPGLVQQRFPAQARTTAASEPIAQLTGTSNVSSHESGEACLFYVGTTRARDYLVLSASEYYGKRRYKRSAYLDALESGLSPDRITHLSWEHTYPQRHNLSTHTDQKLFASDEELSPETRGISQQPSEAFIHSMHTAQLGVHDIEMYQSCPRKYAYAEIYRFSGNPSTYQLFWQATQKTVEELYRCTETNEEQPIPTLPDQDEIIAMYNRHWQKLGGNEMPFATLYAEHGLEIVESVRHQLSLQIGANTNAAITQLRQIFDIEIAGTPLRVAVDRLETLQENPPQNAPQKKGQQRVAFVRTRYGQSKGKPEARTRELLYTLAARKYYPEQPVMLQSRNLSTGESVPITMTSRKEQSLYADIQQSIVGLERHDYAARPDEPYRCPSCPFFWICPI
jgi:Superfamily I DNA and RNA helicases